MNQEINPPNIQQKTLKKRILFVVTQSEFGGAQRFLYELISRLDRNKYEILVVVGKDGDDEFLEILRNVGVSTLSLRFLRRRIDPYDDFRGYLEVRSLIRDFRPDTLFLSSSKAGVLGSLAARRFPHLRVIYRIGGWSFNEPMPWLVRCFYVLAEKCTAKLKDVIIVNNRHDFDQAKKMKIRPRQSIELIYNGIDPYKLEIFGEDEAKIKLFEKLPKKKRGFLHAKIIIGTIANFYKTKGLEYLIEAAKILDADQKIRDVIFVIIGNGPEKEKLELRIKESGLQNSVFLAGRIPNAHKYLKAFDIFVLPSVKEGFPWALLEAMSAKLPIVATAVGANPEIIEDGKNGLLVKPAGPLALAEALARLVDNEPLRREFGIQAHQTVLFKFDLKKMIQQVEDLL